MDKDLAEQVVETARRASSPAARSPTTGTATSASGCPARRDVLHRRPVAARPPGWRRWSGSASTGASRGRPAADPGRGGGHAHRDVRRPPRRGLRAPHPLAVRDGLRRRPAPDRLLDRGAGDVRPAGRRPGRRATGRAAPSRRSRTSGPRSSRGCRPCSWPTTASWSSTGRRSWPSWSAAWSRRPPRRASTRVRSAARSRSPRRCGRPRCSGR